MNEKSVQVIENARLKDVQPGDYIIWEKSEHESDLTYIKRREGIAHHRDGQGDWCTKGHRWITDREGAGITLTIRRIAV